MANSKIQFDVVFKPDGLDEVDKAVKNIEDREVPVRLRPDGKALEQGVIEGPLKKIQEFAARIADGGIGKGISQLQQSVGSFTSALTSGKGITTAFADGIAGIGTEAVAVGASLAAVGLVVMKLGQAMLSANAEVEANQRSVNGLGSAYDGITQATQGLVSATDALALKHGILRAGFQATDQQLAGLSEEAVRYANATGTTVPQAMALMQQAATGNAEAARQLGVDVADTATRAQVLAATLTEVGNRQAGMGGVALTSEQELSRFGNDIKDTFQAVLSIGGSILQAVLGPFLEAIHGITTGIKEAATGLRNLLSSQDSLNQSYAEQLRITDAQAANAQRQAVAERERQQALEYTLSSQIRRADLMGVELGNLQSQRSVQDEINALNIRIEGFQNLSAEERLRKEQEITDVVRRRADLQVEREQGRRATADLNIQLGLLQHHFEQRHINLGLGVQSLTNNQAIAAVEAEINRLMGQALNQGRELTNEEKQRLGTLGQQVEQIRTAATQAAQAAQQQREALQQARQQLELANALAIARNEAHSRTVRTLDVFGELRTVEADITNFHRARGETEQHSISRYQQLVQHASSLREAQGTLIEQALTFGNAQATNREGLRGIGQADNDILSKNIQLHQQAFQFQVQQTMGAYQALAAGQELTQQQVDSLNQTSGITDGLVEGLVAGQERLAQIDLSLADVNQTEAERNTLLEERNTLLSEQVNRQQQLVQLQEQQNGPSFNNQLGATVRNLAGEYRSFGSVMGSVVSSGIQTAANAFKQHYTAVLQGKESIGQALQAMLNETLTSISSESAVKAIFELAEGIAASARAAASYGADVGAVASAGSHYTAAATYAGVAALTGVGAALTMPSGTATAGGGGGSAPGATPYVSGLGGNSANTDPQKQALTVNINTGAVLMTKEQVNDAILAASREAQRRQGMN